jgi:Bacterial Ig-like domain (group 3)
MTATIGGTFTVDTDFTLSVVEADDTKGSPCSAMYHFHKPTSGLGWGDPHITTVDGIPYDFQSAGEFTALRGDGLEIQTRQTPVATTSLPNANPYTGLATCVAIYSAVAARVGTHRVSYEPNISGVPDPSGLQLRVDGVLTTLGSEGIDLGPGGPINQSPTPGATVGPPIGGRIVQPWGGAGIEIDYSDGTILIVTPHYWNDQQKWYLNVNVYGTTADKAIFGKLARGSWLPALPDGTSLEPKPDALHRRYVDLYGKFADAWRVTDATSLFDYAPGTSTATFTDRGWPRENPQSCAIPGQPSAQPVDVGVAQKQCSAIVDNNMKADCVFDVSVTGFTGFAQTYLLTQQRQPGATETAVKDDRDVTTYEENATFTATVAQTTPKGGGAPTGTAQFILDGGKVGNPVTLDSNGRALWSTSGLQVGQHQIVAEYIPTGWGSLFMASTSPEKSHTVIAAINLYFWLVILLLIIILILIAFIIWRYRRTT